MINAPIPGQSLTTEPKNYPWERPPEFTDPDAVIVMHISRLQDEDRMNAILDALEFGEIDLKTLVNGIVRSAVANGLHNIDVGLLAAPVIHEFIKKTATDLEIEFDEGFTSKKKAEIDQKRRSALMARKKLESLGLEQKEPFDRDEEQEDVDTEELMEVEDITTEEPATKRGLGARPEKDTE